MREKIVIFTKNISLLKEGLTEHSRGMKFDILAARSDNPADIKEPDMVTAVISDNAAFINAAAEQCKNLKAAIMIGKEPAEVKAGIVSAAVEPKYANAISEYVTGAVISLTRNFFGQNSALKSGQKSDAPVAQVIGKTLGIVFLDNRTKELAKAAGELGMNVSCIIKDGIPKRFIEEYGLMVAGSIQEVFRTSDIILLSSSDQADRGKISFSELGFARKNPYLLDISEVEMIESLALIDALKKNHLAGMMIDIRPGKAVPEEILKNEKVILTSNNIAGTLDIELSAVLEAVDTAAQKLKDLKEQQPAPAAEPVSK